MEAWIAILLSGFGIVIIVGAGALRVSSMFGGLRTDVANLATLQKHNCQLNADDHVEIKGDLKETKGDMKLITTMLAEQGKAIAYINGQKSKEG